MAHMCCAVYSKKQMLQLPLVQACLSCPLLLGLPPKPLPVFPLPRSTNVFLRHGGSPLRLLLLLFVGDLFPYGVLYHLSARLSFAWARFALPLTVLLPVRSMCAAACQAAGSCWRACCIPCHSLP